MSKERSIWHQRIWSELMKLPTGILQSMYDTIPEGEVRLPKGIKSSIASRDDLAKALAPWLADRDFLR